MSRILLLLTLFATHAAAGQTVGQESTLARSDPPDVPGLWSVREIEAQLHLPALANGLPPGTETEVRVWSGFGLAGIDLLIARRDFDGQWRFFGSSEMDRNTDPTLKPLVDDSTWAARWTAAKEAGLTRLRSSPRRSDNLITTDGYGMVVEWAAAGDHRVIGADNPDAHCSPDDLAFMAAVNALLPNHWKCRR